MKNSTRTLGLGAVVLLASAGGWLACSSENAPIPVVATDAAASSGSSSGGAGSGGDAGASTGDGGAAEAAAAPTCDSYCALVQSACTGANAAYAAGDAGLAECMTACQTWSMGDGGDNGLLCHNTHAGLAVALPNPHCWHAGPYGWGVCGGQCEDFCALTVDWCSPDAGYTGAVPYASAADCLTACAGFTAVSGSATVISAEDGGGAYTAGFSYSAEGPTSGNSRDCREWHLGVALQSPTNRTPHCTHLVVDSGTCVGTP